MVAHAIDNLNSRAVPLHDFVTGEQSQRANIAQVGALAASSQIAVPLDEQMAALYGASRSTGARSQRS